VSSQSSESSSSCRASRAVLFDLLDTAKMHGLDTSNVSSRVESRRVEPSGIWAYVRVTCFHLLTKNIHNTCNDGFLKNYSYTGK